MKFQICICLFIFLSFKIEATNIDSILRVQVNALNDTGKCSYYLKLSRAYLEIQDYSKSAMAATKGLRVAQFINNDEWIAKLQMFAGIGFREFKADSSIFYLEKAYVYFKAKKHPWINYCFDNLGSLYATNNLYIKSLELCQEAIDYNTFIKDSLSIGLFMCDFAYVYDRKGDYHLAIEKCRETLEWNKKVKSKLIEAKAIGQMGIAYDELKMFDSAHFYNNRAVTLFGEIGDSNSMKQYYNNIGNTYLKQKKWDLAEVNILKSLEGVNWEYQIVRLSNLGKLYLETNREAQAEKILMKAIANAKKVKNDLFLSEAYYFMHELYIKNNKPIKALEYHKMYKSVIDSIDIRNRNIQYDIMKMREKTIAQEQKLYKAETLLSAKNKYIILLSILALLLVSIGIKAYRLQQSKRKRETLLHAEKLLAEKERISKDLHDNIGSQLTFLIAGTERDNTPEQLKELNQFARDTLDQLRNTVWAIKKNAIISSDFSEELERYVSKLNGKSKLDLHFETVGLNNNLLPPNVAISFFRLLQEAISNVIKHARANNAFVTLILSEGHIQLSIKDDGVGLPESKAESGFGLLFMQQRMEEIEGAFSIHPNRPNGTIISASWNFPA